jgi:Flp pilus assembly protein TadG
VEFAIVAPLLFLFVFGLIEYGRMVMVQQVITNASREAARRAVLDGATYAEVNTYVSGYLTSAAIPAAAVKPIVMNPSNPASATYGAPVSVTVSIDFNKVSWLPKPIWLGGKSLQATTTMRRESAS